MKRERKENNCCTIEFTCISLIKNHRLIFLLFRVQYLMMLRSDRENKVVCDAHRVGKKEIDLRTSQDEFLSFLDTLYEKEKADDLLFTKSGK